MFAHPLPGHHHWQDGVQDDHSQIESTYTCQCVDVPVLQAVHESEVVDPGGLLPHLDEEAAPGPEPCKPGGPVQQQALPELSPLETWCMPSCEWPSSTWMPVDCPYFQHGYNTAMMQGLAGTYTIHQQDPVPEANCKGKGNGKAEGNGSRQRQRCAKAAAARQNENTW